MAQEKDQPEQSYLLNKRGTEKELGIQGGSPLISYFPNWS
jgi:hypothetical protein